MKKMKEILAELKGTGNENKTVTGKGSYSATTFSKMVSAAVNDSSYKFKSMGKDGKPVETSIRDLFVSDVRKTIANAKYPQKSEIGVLNTSEIATDGISKAIAPLVTEYIRSGRKFSLPAQSDFGGEIYLAPVKGKTKTSNVRDFKTGQTVGTSTSTTKDHVQVRAKSPVPKHLVTKVRKDANGKVI